MTKTSAHAINRLAKNDLILLIASLSVSIESIFNRHNPLATPTDVVALLRLIKMYNKAVYRMSRVYHCKVKGGYLSIRSQEKWYRSKEIVAVANSYGLFG